MPNLRTNYVIAIATFAIGLATTCSSDRSVQPAPVKYGIYVAADRFGTIYIADTDSLKVIDSIPGVGECPFLTASPTGEYVFINSWRPEVGFSLQRYSTASQQITASLPMNFISGATPLLNGKYLLSTLDSVNVIDVATFQPKFGLPSNLRLITLALSSDSEVVLEVPDSTEYRLFNVFSGRVSGGYRPHLKSGAMLRGLPTFARYFHARSRRIVLLAQIGVQTTYLIVGDMDSGETVFEYRLYFPFGDIAFSSDGRLMAVSDPSNWGFDETPISVDLFDFRTLTHIRRFTTQTSRSLESPDRLAFLPGDTTLLLIPGRNPKGGDFQILDISSGEIVRSSLIPTSPSFTGGVAIAPY